MKKLLSVFLVSVLLTISFSSCTLPMRSGDGLSIVTTIFPLYDWVRNVVGDDEHVNVTLLMDNGVDLHSFQPGAEDILRISACDLFIYVGGESDEWVDEALKEAVNPDMIVLDLISLLGENAREEELREGMQSEEEEEEEDGEEVEYDEHVWLSLRNAAFFTAQIAEALGKLDPSCAKDYTANADAYKAKLEDLDVRYLAAVSSAKQKTLLFADRFPFRYLTEDYGLDYYAAFLGCSAETEASFATVTFLSKKVDELKLNAVLTIEGSDQRIAKTVVSNSSRANCRILTMDSMQSTVTADIAAGGTYLSVMEKNLLVLTEALQ